MTAINVTPRRVVRSELIKLATLRSTTITFAVAVAAMVGISVLIAWATVGNWDTMSPADRRSTAVEEVVLSGRFLAQLAIGVLGVMAVTGEYATGMIRATLAATPRRGAVLAAKAVVLSGTLVVAGTVTAFAGYFGGNFFLEREGIGLALSDDGVLRSMFGSGLYLAGLGLLAAAVGLLVRHTAAALSIVLALVFVVGTMAFLLPGTWGEWTAKLLPGNAGSGVVTPVSFNPELLDPWVGFAAFCAEIAAVLLIGFLVFRRRDA